MTDEQPGEPVVRSQRWSLSLVWLVPLVAALIGLSMLVRAWQEAGPVIQITFESAEGLAPGQTPVKFRNVVIGEITDVELSDDNLNVIISVELDKEATAFTREDSRYWIVRPRIGTGGVSGLDTLFSGDFIAADPGTSPRQSTHFTGLQSPPPVTHGEEGKSFTLLADSLGSLRTGAPVYYRNVRVGQVVSHELSESGDGVRVNLFVSAPYDSFVRTSTRFWNASGIGMDISASGLEVRAESLVSVLSGGVAFANRATGASAPLAEEGAGFRLFGDRAGAMAPGKGRPQTIRMRFDQSLRGLKAGSAVEFMGKEVGEVTMVTLEFDARSQSFPITVDARVFPRLMGLTQDALPRARDEESREDAVATLLNDFVGRGLRAEARAGNLLTGNLYIALEFYPEAEGGVTDASLHPVNIPTRPASLDNLQQQLSDLTEQISNLPLENIATHLDESLVELRRTLGQINNDVLPATLTTFQGIDKVMDQMEGTLESASETFDRDSPERRQLDQTLRGIERMSLSVRELSDYLRRHPEAMLRGRQHPEGRTFDE